MRISETTPLSETVMGGTVSANLNDTMMSKSESDAVMVVNVFDTLNNETILFNVKYVTYYMTGELHDIVESIESGSFEDRMRVKTISSVRDYFFNMYCFKLEECRYEIGDIYIVHK